MSLKYRQMVFSTLNNISVIIKLLDNIKFRHISKPVESHCFNDPCFLSHKLLMKQIHLISAEKAVSYEVSLEQVLVF